MPHSNPPPGRPRGNGVHLAVIAFYTLLFFALIWPVYPMFATIEPRVLGVPFSMAYVVGALLLSFFVLLAFFLWERSQGVDQPTPEGGE